MDSDELQDGYQKALSALNESKFSYEAAKSLYAEGAISKEEYVKAETLYNNDRITVDAYDIADKVNIKSPIAGTVTRVNVNIGRYANDTDNSAPMFIVEDLQNLKMDVNISEYDISKIKLGQKVTITAEVLGDKSGRRCCFQNLPYRRTKGYDLKRNGDSCSDRCNKSKCKLDCGSYRKSKDRN